MIAPDMFVCDIDVPGYECVRYCDDAASGLRAIIAVHSTRLGPALGGTRFKTYPDDAAALLDAERLARGMTSKAAAAGLHLGGGKAVIIGDPAADKSSELLRAYGRFVDSFGGRYVTAADVGTNSADLDIVGETTTYVVGRSVAAGGTGDSGHSTALGVLVSIRAAVRFVLDRPLEGVRVGVEGAGKVGFPLIGLLLAEGADVVVSEPVGAARARVRDTYAGIRFSSDLFVEPLDVYAPCALGGTLTRASVARLRARVVCGGANNQLFSDDVGDALALRRITWVPDYVANAGGVIQVGGEYAGLALDKARDTVAHLGDRVTTILTHAKADGLTPLAAADAIVADRLARGV